MDVRGLHNAAISWTVLTWPCPCPQQQPRLPSLRAHQHTWHWSSPGAGCSTPCSPAHSQSTVNTILIAVFSLSPIVLSPALHSLYTRQLRMGWRIRRRASQHSEVSAWRKDCHTRSVMWCSYPITALTSPACYAEEPQTMQGGVAGPGCHSSTFSHNNALTSTYDDPCYPPSTLHQRWGRLCCTGCSP